MLRSLPVCGLLLLVAQLVSAEVVRVDVRRRDDFGTHERVIGRVHFAIDPKLAANRAIADIDLAPTNAEGKVEFSSDLLFFRPKQASRARGSVFLEVVNRGRDQSLAIMSDAQQRDMSPESWNLGDRFLLEQGFAVAFIGWQFDVEPSDGLTFQAPVAPVEGIVRATHIETLGGRTIRFGVAYCASDPSQQSATLTFRTRMDEAPRLVPRNEWQFFPDGCSARLGTAASVGIYEIVYQAKGSPVAGLGLAAMRDFAAYLHYGAAGATLRETPAALERVIGYGYSQSGRFLREFVRDGFNADERGRAAFDALMIASAGAGAGSFNHRFAMPGVAGNSVLSVLRPVDIPPFTDEGLLARAQAARVTPKIFYTFSSTEYWARAGSLTHTDEGRQDAPLAATSRLYFLAGTPHASGPLPAAGETFRSPYQHVPNFATQQWATRALLLELDAWARNGTEPPPSQYPSMAKGELVPQKDVRFPTVPSFPFATYMPQVWRLDFGPQYGTTKIISFEPPRLGAPYQILVPQVNPDGNDVAGVRLPEVVVPLGTYTGWNVTRPQLSDLGYLSGLVGGFEPFAPTKAQREQSGDARLSIAERYTGRQDYLGRVRRAADDLVRLRFLRREDVPAVLQRAEQIWNAVVGAGTR
ncbi:MAG: alpha/beta hydrolase domain-containing protein [Vicinamibacterales bacterium]